MLRKFIILAFFLILTISPAMAVSPAYDQVGGGNKGSFGYDLTNLVWRAMAISANGAMLTATDSSALTAQFSIITAPAGTFEITLGSEPESWVIQNLSATQTVYYNLDTGDADTGDLQLLPRATLSGSAPQTTFEFYAADTVSVQIYSEY